MVGVTPPPDGDGAARTPDEADVALVNATLQGSTEAEQSESLGRPSQKLEDQIPGIKFLASLMKATLFTDLFVYHAHIRFMHATPQERVAALKQEHGTFYKWCRNSDYIARVVLMIGTTGLVGAVAVGTVLKLFYA